MLKTLIKEPVKQQNPHKGPNTKDGNQNEFIFLKIIPQIDGSSTSQNQELCIKAKKLNKFSLNIEKNQTQEQPNQKIKKKNKEQSSEFIKQQAYKIVQKQIQNQQKERNIQANRQKSEQYFQKQNNSLNDKQSENKSNSRVPKNNQLTPEQAMDLHRKIWISILSLTSKIDKVLTKIKILDRIKIISQNKKKKQRISCLSQTSDNDDNMKTVAQQNIQQKEKQRQIKIEALYDKLQILEEELLQEQQNLNWLQSELRKNPQKYRKIRPKLSPLEIEKLLQLINQNEFDEQSESLEMQITESDTMAQTSNDQRQT